jgi:alpha-galactosidase
MIKKVFYHLLCLLCLVLMSHPAWCQPADIWLSDLDLSKMSCAMGIPKTNKSIKGDSMTIAGERFKHGVGTQATSRMLIGLDGKGKSFSARVGLDDVAYVYASIAFTVLGDKKVLWESGPMKRGDKAKDVNVDISGVKKLGLLVTVVRDDISENYANWAEARISFSGEKPGALNNDANVRQLGVLTPPAPFKPRINGPASYGVRPGSPFLYRIPATGNKPLTFSAKALPADLNLDKTTGIITGKITIAGKYPVELMAKNAKGTSKRNFTIVVSDTLALTPPMGWNSWYIHYNRVSDSLMRLAADIMINSGMADYGYQYVNIDDCWMSRPDSKNQEEMGPARDENGRMLTNKRFPDMKAMTNYIHYKGLKAGIYSSPGPKTCGGYTGSYQHEQQDAETFAAWGFDFLKYDWCSYGSVAKGRSLDDMKAPYKLMWKELKSINRDIIFNLCQYGMGDVWKWGSEAGNSWRTTGDLGLSSGSFLPGFYTIGMTNATHWEYAHPGAWNDPDYIMIGWVGNAHGMGNGIKTTLTSNEQYAYISMWSLMAAPLFFSGDMANLDSFSLNVLCNNEVIDIDQDVMGHQAKVLRNDQNGMIMVKDLADHSKAVGLFNFPGDKKNPVDYFAWENVGDGSRRISFTSAEIGVHGKFKVRDVWSQKDLGVFEKRFEIKVPYHGVMLLKIIQ